MGLGGGWRRGRRRWIRRFVRRRRGGRWGGVGGWGRMGGGGGGWERGEAALDSGIRETQEEVGVTPTGLEQVGELYFQFLDGYKLHVAVFAASGCEGELCETSEAAPIWTDIDKRSEERRVG